MQNCKDTKKAVNFLLKKLVEKNLGLFVLDKIFFDHRTWFVDSRSSALVNYLALCGYAINNKVVYEF